MCNVRDLLYLTLKKTENEDQDRFALATIEQGLDR
nr:MAG TPA: hypothetical protein [Caudoviricetes sp.]